jgi:hypothetical protein
MISALAANCSEVLSYDSFTAIGIILDIDIKRCIGWCEQQTRLI